MNWKSKALKRGEDMKDEGKICSSQKRIHVNKLLEAIIAEAEVARRKANFVEQIGNIRKMSFLIGDRIRRFNRKESRRNEYGRNFWH